MIENRIKCQCVDKRHTLDTILLVKVIRWNPEKNEWLKKHRGVCFEQIEEILRSDRELAGFDHPNQIKYPGQRMVIVELNNYAYLVPCLENDDEIFLKTVIPNRKATKKYLR